MYFAGIDIGSTSSKTAVFCDDVLEKTFMIPTGWSSVKTAESIYEKLEEEGIFAENAIYTATGYGRISVPYAQKTVTEITCHGKGADYIFKQDGTVIDIGGQDTKIIKLKNGRVDNFIMNDKCSAGTGRFLEIMANTLGVSLEQLSEMASRGQGITISSMCTVFAESEVISLIGNATKREDIAYGVVQSVIAKVSQLSSKLDGEKYFLTGGLCENQYVIESLEKALGKPVESDPLARYAGAIGAALCGKKLV